uniref:Chromo domain-containing protein n=1 Tax=Haptolina ericina TaxID=156174 RepID=A0A7S3B222_9EUKA
MAAARVANTLVGRPDPALYTSQGSETVQQVAATFNVRPVDIVNWNVGRYSNITINSRVQAGTVLFVMDPGQVDTMSVDKQGETPKKLAARLGVSTTDLLELNALRFPSLTPMSKLKAGTELVFRDRSAEPEVFMPNKVEIRTLDTDGSLALALQRQDRHGDPTTTGVVWPRIAEVALLAGLGCGKTLVRLALDELKASKAFDFAVLQATMASVSFYEELGFVRVGAIARYVQDGSSLDETPVQGYRHWACADESQPEQFGDTSYMMALELRNHKECGIAGKLSKRLEKKWPTVQASDRKGKRSAGNEAVVGSSALQVGDMSLNIAEGDDARLQLRYEVEQIVDCRGSNADLEYLVKWKHFSLDDATWEPTTAELLKSEVAKAAISRFKKHSGRGGPQQPSPAASAGGGALSNRKRPAGTDGGKWGDGVTGAARWAHKVVRSLYVPEQAVSPRIFTGGLGELPKDRMAINPPAEPTVLDKEHRYWLVIRFASTTSKCTLVPLLAAGRFGGCGRRAGRIRWKPAPLKQGHEREAYTSALELVPSEPVTGVREADGEAWCVDDYDVEQAAREQAAAARNKRRRIIEDAEAAAAGPIDPALLVGRRAVAHRPYIPKPKLPPGEARVRTGAPPVRKKKRLAPASSNCLACTKGKHCAHTCGIRGKLAEERRAAELAALATASAAAVEGGALAEASDAAAMV